MKWKRRPKAPQQMSNKQPNERQLFEAARDVVERARAGDQVAMAILAQVRDNAKAGDARAKASFRIMERYIARNPPTNFGVCDVTHSESLKAMWGLGSLPSPDVAADVVMIEAPKVRLWQAIVALVHAPKGDALISAVDQKIPEGAERESFRKGANIRDAGTDTAHLGFWKLGRIFALGRAIQRLQDESIPIAAFCPVVAWELGE